MAAIGIYFTISLTKNICKLNQITEVYCIAQLTIGKSHMNKIVLKTPGHRRKCIIEIGRENQEFSILQLH